MRTCKLAVETIDDSAAVESYLSASAGGGSICEHLYVNACALGYKREDESH